MPAAMCLNRFMKRMLEEGSYSGMSLMRGTKKYSTTETIPPAKPESGAITATKNWQKKIDKEKILVIFNEKFLSCT